MYRLDVKVCVLKTVGVRRANRSIKLHTVGLIMKLRWVAVSTRELRDNHPVVQPITIKESEY